MAAIRPQTRVFDRILNLVVVAAPFVVGVLITFLPVGPEHTSKASKRLRWVFGGVLVFLSALTYWQQQRADDAHQKELADHQKAVVASATKIGELGGQVGTLQQTITGLKQQLTGLTSIATSTSKTSNTLLQLAEQQRRNSGIPTGLTGAGAAKELADKVAGLLSARHIDDQTAAQIERLLRNVPSPPEVLVTTILGDAEAFQYAIRLMDVLRAGGWKVIGPDQGLYGRPITGLVVEVANPKDPAMVGAATALGGAFQSAGIPIVGAPLPPSKAKSPTSIVLLVGSKPPT